MRTIKFRGKDVKTGEWKYGHLITLNVNDKTVYLIITDDYAALNKELKPWEIAFSLNVDIFMVDPNTVGQFTGLLDKNGKEIYEGDICHLGDPRITYVLLWIDCGLKAKQIGAYGSFCGVTYWAETMTIVGNIHDNPELIEKGEISYVL